MYLWLKVITVVTVISIIYGITIIFLYLNARCTYILKLTWRVARTINSASCVWILNCKSTNSRRPLDCCSIHLHIHSLISCRIQDGTSSCFRDDVLNCLKWIQYPMNWLSNLFLDVGNTHTLLQHWCFQLYRNPDRPCSHLAFHAPRHSATSLQNPVPLLVAWCCLTFHRKIVATAAISVGSMFTLYIYLHLPWKSSKCR